MAGLGLSLNEEEVILAELFVSDLKPYRVSGVVEPQSPSQYLPPYFEAPAGR